MREKEMQAKVKQYAEKHYGEIKKGKKKRKARLLCVKLTMLAMYGQAGWPDLMFTATRRTELRDDNLYLPYTFFIEMKKPGEVSTPIQAAKQAELRALGYVVEVCDSIEEACAVVDREMREAR